MAFPLRRPTLTDDILAARTQIEHDIGSHRAWYIIQGALFLLIGFLALILPGVVAVSAELFIGSLLLVSGVFQLIASYRSRMHWWSFLSAALSIVIGGWMLWSPLAGLIALVMALAIFFTIEGIFEIMLAFEFRPARQWGWMLASGIISLVLAFLLWSGLPVLSIFYLSLIIAINFVFYGLSLLMLALGYNNQASQQSQG